MTRAAPKAEQEPTGTITTKQMRQLHALLRDHGITGDKAVHAYLDTWLREQGHEPVESRTDLTATVSAHLLAELEAEPVAHTATDARLQALRAEFPAEHIGKLPKSTCRDCSQSQNKRCSNHNWVSNCPACHGGHSSATMHIDYVGHADVTARLLEVDPLWGWEPAEVGPTGHPSIAASTDRDGNLWIRLTVLGVTRLGVGDGKNAKERIGDALRNAAMRFGVALDLWAKGDRDWAHSEKHGTDQHPDTQPARAPSQDQGEPGYHGPSTAELVALIQGHAERAGTTYEQITAKWRGTNGNMPVEALAALLPHRLAPLEHQIATYLEQHPPTPSGAPE